MVSSAGGVGTAPTPDGTIAADAVSALTNLGYQQPEASKAVAAVMEEDRDADVSTLIRLALKRLSGS